MSEDRVKEPLKTGDRLLKITKQRVAEPLGSDGATTHDEATSYMLRAGRVTRRPVSQKKPLTPRERNNLSGIVDSNVLNAIDEVSQLDAVDQANALKRLIPDDIITDVENVASVIRADAEKNGEAFAFIDDPLGLAGYGGPGDNIDLHKFVGVIRDSFCIHLTRMSSGGAGRYDDLDSRRELFTPLDTAWGVFKEQGNVSAADTVRALKDSYLAMLTALRVETLWESSSRNANAFGEIRTTMDSAKKAEKEFADIDVVFRALSQENISEEWRAVMNEFNMIMKNQTYDENGNVITRSEPYTHAEMMNEIHERSLKNPSRVTDPGVWARKVAWALFRVTGNLAIIDPNIENREEDKGVKKVVGSPFEAFVIEQRRKAKIPERMLNILNQPVEPIELRDKKGKVSVHGYKLDGRTPMTHGDVFGMSCLWLELSSKKLGGEAGGFWKLQKDKAGVLREVILRHQREGILDEQGKPIEYPVDAEDLKLIDWTNVGTTSVANQKGKSSPILFGSVYDSWLEVGDFCERSRALMEQVISAVREGIPGMEAAVKLAGEKFGEAVKDTTLFYSHVHNERAEAELAWIKGEAFEVYLTFAEYESSRDAKFRDETNMVVAALGGDAKRNREIYGRDMSFASLSAEPPSPYEAMTWLLGFATDKDGKPTEIPYSYTGAKEYRRFGHSIRTTEDVVNMAAPNGWRPERRGQTFFQWMQEHRDDMETCIASGTLTKKMTKDEQRQLFHKLQIDMGEPKRSGESAAEFKQRVVSARNMFAFMMEFSYPIFRLSMFQQNFIDRVARKAVNYRKRPLPQKYEAYLQYEAIVKALLDNTDSRTSDGGGDRFMKFLYSGIYGSQYDRKYTKPPARTWGNKNVVLEHDDWRVIDYTLLMGTREWVKIAYEELGYNPSDPNDEKNIPLRQREKYDDITIRRLIFEFAKQRSSIGQKDAVGYYDLKDILQDQKTWWASDLEFYADLVKQYAFGVVDKSSKQIKEELEMSKQKMSGFAKGLPLLGQVVGGLQSIDGIPWVTSPADLLVWSSFVYPFAVRALAKTALNFDIPFIGHGELLGASIPLINQIPAFGNVVFAAINPIGIASAIVFRQFILKGHLPFLNWGIPVWQDYVSVHGLLSLPQLEFNRFGKWAAVRAVNNPHRGEEVNTQYSQAPL